MAAVPLTLEALMAMPVHGPEGRVAAVREAMGLRQSDLAAQLRRRGGRCSRETVSHWENVDHNGQPRARVSKGNAELLAEFARERLKLKLPDDLFYEREETSWDVVARQQRELLETVAAAMPPGWQTYQRQILLELQEIRKRLEALEDYPPEAAAGS